MNTIKHQYNTKRMEDKLEAVADKSAKALEKFVVISTPKITSFLSRCEAWLDRKLLN